MRVAVQRASSQRQTSNILVVSDVNYTYGLSLYMALDQHFGWIGESLTRGIQLLVTYFYFKASEHLHEHRAFKYIGGHRQ